MIIRLKLTYAMLFSYFLVPSRPNYFSVYSSFYLVYIMIIRLKLTYAMLTYESKLEVKNKVKCIFYYDPLDVVKWNNSPTFIWTMVCCYYTKILFTYDAISKRAKLQKNVKRFSIRPITIKCNLLFLVSMSKAIFKLNHTLLWYFYTCRFYFHASKSDISIYLYVI